MTKKLLLQVALSTILVGMFSTQIKAKEVSCRVVKNGVEHVAKIMTSSGKVESFFYGSMGKNGNTCEVIGSRQKKGSSWIDGQGNKALVSLSFNGDEIAKISLLNADPNFTINILTPLTNICGVGGYIAKSVVINVKKKTCILQD
ncbi:MAG: hypothetical protein ACXU8A_01730 [Burkholderiaceae bacterium]